MQKVSDNKGRSSPTNFGKNTSYVKSTSNSNITSKNNSAIISGLLPFQSKILNNKSIPKK